MPLSQFTSQQLYQFWKQGDANLDGVIDDKDLDLISDFIGSFYPAADINEDGSVTTLDLQLASANYGLTIYTYYNTFDHDLPLYGIIGIFAVVGASALLKVWWGKKKPYNYDE